MSRARDPACFPLLAGLTAECKARADDALRWRRFQPGEVILDQDDSTGDVLFLAQGRLLAVYWTRDGREIIFSAIPEGDYFGELTALDGAPRSLCVYARTAAELAVMPGAVFRRLIDDSPIFRQTILTGLSRRVRDLTERTCQLTAFSVEDRLRAFILRSAAGAGCLHAGAVLRGFPTHAEIAARIGANREAVSRALSALRQQGVLVAHRGNLTIHDPNSLMP